jgi:hypothetical protein
MYWRENKMYGSPYGIVNGGMPYDSYSAGRGFYRPNYSSNFKPFFTNKELSNIDENFVLNTLMTLNNNLLSMTRDTPVMMPVGTMTAGHFLTPTHENLDIKILKELSLMFPKYGDLSDLYYIIDQRENYGDIIRSLTKGNPNYLSTLFSNEDLQMTVCQNNDVETLYQLFQHNFKIVGGIYNEIFMSFSGVLNCMSDKMANRKDN